MESLLTVETLVAAAKELGIESLALTDHNTTAGHGELEFFCEQVGIKPIFGLELDVLYAGSSEQAPLVALARNAQGYANLLRLASLQTPVPLGQLLEFARGLVFLEGGEGGRVSQLVQSRKLAEAQHLLDWYNAEFGSDFYLRYDLGQSVDLFSVFPTEQFVLCQDVRWSHDQSAAHEALHVLSQIGRREGVYPPFPLLSWESLTKRFMGPPGVIENTLELAAMCNVSLPRERILPPHPDGHSLGDLVWSGAQRRFGKLTQEIRERLEYELAIITDQGFSDYFLIVSDIVGFAKESGIPVGPGRGSAASSLVAYCLGITEVNPLEWGLLFERFLNKARHTRPDIDLDFCYERRAEVLAYVSRRFGREHVAQIGTYGTFGERSAMQEVKRALGFDHPQIAREIQGLKRHRATHAAGVIITAQPIQNVSAIYQDRDLAVTQLDMYSLERLGALKIDLLGLRTLTLLTKMEAAVQRHDPGFNLNQIPLADQATFELLALGKSLGIFQLESALFQDLLRSLDPQSFGDLVALLALGRPGPLDMFPEYLRRRKNQRQVQYLSEDLAQILGETYGLILYQEQVILIAHKVAGLSLGDADMLRVALGKNDQISLQMWQERFVRGAQARGLSPQEATGLFRTIVDFSGYAFNKAHSVSYALLTWRGAYLKTHYPLEFYSTLLNEGVSLQEQSAYLLACQSQGIEILPPSVVYSQAFAIPEGGGLRLGLASIRQLSPHVVTKLMEVRSRGGWTNFRELRRQVKLDTKIWETLILAGACDELGSRNSHLKELGLMDLSERELLSRERELVGVYVSQHPGSTFLPLMRNLQGDLEVVVGEVLQIKRAGKVVTGVLDSPEGSINFRAVMNRENQGIKPGTAVALFGAWKHGFWHVEWQLPLGPTLLVSPQPNQLEELKDVLNQQNGTRPVVLRLGEGIAYHLLPREFWVKDIHKVDGDLQNGGVTHIWFDPWKELLS